MSGTAKECEYVYYLVEVAGFSEVESGRRPKRFRVGPPTSQDWPTLSEEVKLPRNRRILEDLELETSERLIGIMSGYPQLTT